MLSALSSWEKTARDVLTKEAQALQRAVDCASPGIARACELILAHSGKVVVSGIGKSGHVGRKIAATLSSTGTRSVFMHPSEAVHGDLGVYSPGDPSILLSKSGTTSELISLVPMLRKLGSPLIAVVGNPGSPLGELADVVIDASVNTEADQHNLAPTSSSTVAMAIGDAISVVLMQARGFTPDDFAQFHPGGQLGRNLRLHVSEVMKRGENFPYVSANDTVKDVIVAMTKRPIGAACVVDSNRRLLGLITDGDLRRALLVHDDIRSLHSSDIMTKAPTVISSSALVSDALLLMENRLSKLSVLPVVDDGICVGLIQIHDIYSP